MGTSIQTGRAGRPGGLRAGIVIGLSLAFMGVVVGTAAGADTPFQKVLIVNAPASPIPVVQQGAISVSNLPSNQSVTVSNFPATQSVSGTVTAKPVVVTKVHHDTVDIDPNDSFESEFGGIINVSTVIVSTSDSIFVQLDTQAGGTVVIHDGEGFSQEFPIPVPARAVDLLCLNNVLTCSAFVTVLGTAP